MRAGRDLERLRAIALFGGLTLRELKEIRRVSRDMEFREGETIVSEGLIGDDFYVIVQGEARVTQKGEEVGILGSGDYFGEIAVILGVARTATVTTTSRVLAMRLDSAGFHSVLDSMPSIARKVLIQVTRRLVEVGGSRSTELGS